MRIRLIVAALLVAAPALADDPLRGPKVRQMGGVEATPQSQPVPAQQAMAQMLMEAQNREAQALMQAYALRAQVESLNERLGVEKKRADDAEAKVKPQDKPDEQKHDEQKQ